MESWLNPLAGFIVGMVVGMIFGLVLGCRGQSGPGDEAKKANRSPEERSWDFFSN